MGEGHGVGKGRRAVLASVLLLGLPVWAAEQKPAAADASKSEASVGEETLPSDEEKAAGTEEKKGLRVRPFGRVYARVSADERDAYERSLSIPSARVGLAASLSHVDAEVTAE